MFGLMETILGLCPRPQACGRLLMAGFPLAWLRDLSFYFPIFKPNLLGNKVIVG